ncbi:MAG: hypothetical protein V3R65_06695 [Acidiferrobacterales bacterium]
MRITVKRSFTKPLGRLVLMLMTAAAITGCGSSSTPTEIWTWVSGSDVVGQSGVYGTKGTADGANVPGARYGSISWIDSSGDLWLFGGYGRDSAGTGGHLNDLWQFDGTNWTWVSGSNVVDQAGTYGVKGTADAANVPGARNYSISWLDGNGDLWLFGGDGYDSAGTEDTLNDLWRYQP